MKVFVFIVQKFSSSQSIEMKFSAYDILSALVPGFVILFTLIHVGFIPFNKDILVLYTGIAFLIGYFVNTFSSWIEDLLFWTWGGKPSVRILEGQQIWKVKFFAFEEAKRKLREQSESANPKNEELFYIALRDATGNEKVNAMNTSYIFSRVILVTIIICVCLYMISGFITLSTVSLSVFFIFVAWLRCKQRAYYFVREVLNTYLKNYK